MTPKQAIEVIDNLYRSEINISITTLWDGRYDVKLGDNMNGFKAEGNVDEFINCAQWLKIKAKEHFPTSAFTKWCNGMKFKDAEKLLGKVS